MPPLPTPFPVPTGVPEEVPPEMIAYFWDPTSLYPSVSAMQSVWIFIQQYHFLEIALVLFLIMMAINFVWEFVERRTEDI